MILDEIGYYGPYIIDAFSAVYFVIYYPSIWLLVIIGILIALTINNISEQIKSEAKVVSVFDELLIDVISS